MIVLCSVCFSGSDPIIRDSLNAGIFVLLGVTGLVLACFAYFFFQLAQRARAVANLAARGESLAAFDPPSPRATAWQAGRCLLADGVAPPSNMLNILSRHALPARRLARLGATPDFHHGLPGEGDPLADDRLSASSAAHPYPR